MLRYWHGNEVGTEVEGQILSILNKGAKSLEMP